MSTAIDKYIEELKTKYREADQALTIINILIHDFPDLDIKHTRWGDILLHSKSVNDDVDDCVICHSCGCCNDSPLLVRPFKSFILNNVVTKIYSNPPEFCIGEKMITPVKIRDSDGDEKYATEEIRADWIKILKTEHISDKVIEKVAKYANEHGDLTEELTSVALAKAINEALGD